MEELLDAGLQMMRQSAMLVSAMTPDAWAPPAWREVQNKLEAFQCFQRGGSLLERTGRDPGAALRAGLARAATLAPYPRLWTVEGIGYAFGGAARAAAEEGVAVFSEERCGPLPPAALLPLHTGFGLALAAPAVERLAAGAAPAQTLRELARRCEASARPGCAAASLEALGLAARTLRPERVAAIDRAFAALDGAMRELFWHGVGRALYFVPSNLAPWGSAAERAAQRALAEAPDEPARRNALAGVAWAVTLVNIRHPEVVAAALDGEALAAYPEAVAHGTGAAVLLWALANGRDATLERFLRGAPAAAGGELGERWRRWVLEPCEQALREVAPPLARSGRCGELFRALPWAEVRGRLAVGDAR